MPPKLNLTGKVFGRLVAIGPVGRAKYGVFWFCVCECFNTTKVIAASLTQRKTRSCGCLHYETVSKNGRATTTHGGRRRGPGQSTLYRIWTDMIRRCHNPNREGYKNYGGRGITVCDRWLGDDGFVNFRADMGERPSNKHSINRIDNDGIYQPSNCEWTTHNPRGPKNRP